MAFIRQTGLFAWEQRGRRRIWTACGELPLGYALTKASANDSLQLAPLVRQLKTRYPGLVQRAQYLSAGKVYDSHDNNRDLFDEHGIRPVLDIRTTWQEEPERPRPVHPDHVDTIGYTEQGAVLCRCRGGASENIFDQREREGTKDNSECAARVLDGL